MWGAIHLLIIGAAVGVNLLYNQRHRRAWQETAESCGLQVRKFSTRGVHARAGEMDVRIDAQPGSGDKGKSTRVTIVVPGPLDFVNVAIFPGLSSRAREIEVGDVSFDSAFSVKGPAPLVLSLLDAETRRLLLGLKAESNPEISMGALRADMADKKLPDLLPRLVDFGQRLAQSMNVPERLAENAKGDPEARVRLNNLLVLSREFPRDWRTVEVLRKACSDPSPEIRLRAAKELGTEGRSVLFELLESLEEDTLRAEAVSALAWDLPAERARTLLDQALRGDHFQTAHACLEALGKSRAAAAAAALAQVLDQERDELAVAAALALGEAGNPDAEPSLIRALEREPAALRVVAANALGRVGSAAAVLPLKEASERSLLDLDLRKATRQAIAEIQSRLEGASPGQLSLAGAETGQLSLAADPAGQVSLSGGEDERS